MSKSLLALGTSEPKLSIAILTGVSWKKNAVFQKMVCWSTFILLKENCPKGLKRMFILFNFPTKESIYMTTIQLTSLYSIIQSGCTYWNSLSWKLQKFRFNILSTFKLVQALKSFHVSSTINTHSIIIIP